MRNTVRVKNDIVSEIFKKIDEEPNRYIHYVYKQVLRFLINKFSNLSYINGKNDLTKIKCYHANQERAVGIIFSDANVILPVITISENSTALFDKKQRYTPLLIDEKFWYPKIQRAVRFVSLPPRPIRISYTINVWSFYKNDLDQVREMLFSMFNPDLNVTVGKDFCIKAFIETEDDDSEVKVSDKEDRVLQKALNISVETFLPSPRFLYTSTGKIEKFNYEIDFATGKLTEDSVASLDNLLATIKEAEIVAGASSGGTQQGPYAPEEHSHEQYVTPEELQSMTWLTN